MSKAYDAMERAAFLLYVAERYPPALSWIERALRIAPTRLHVPSDGAQGSWLLMLRIRHLAQSGASMPRGLIEQFWWALVPRAVRGGWAWDGICSRKDCPRTSFHIHPWGRCLARHSEAFPI